MRLAEQYNQMFENEEKPKYYCVFTFEGMDSTSDEIDKNHATLIYFGEKDETQIEEIKVILDNYFRDNTFDKFEGTFSKEEMFGPDKDVRVLTSETKEEFLPDLRDELAPYNGSQFKGDYKPHYTTDLPAPQKVKVNALIFSTTGYETIKRYGFN